MLLEDFLFPLLLKQAVEPLFLSGGLKLAPPVLTNRTRGPPPLREPSALTARPEDLTGIAANSETIRREFPGVSFCARTVTRNLDGIHSVISPAPVVRNESVKGSPASRCAAILPTAVQARRPPATWVSRMVPPALSQLAPPLSEPTAIGPPELRIVTRPLALT